MCSNIIFQKADSLYFTREKVREKERRKNAKYIHVYITIIKLDYTV